MVGFRFVLVLMNLFLETMLLFSHSVTSDSVTEKARDDAGSHDLKRDIEMQRPKLAGQVKTARHSI